MPNQLPKTARLLPGELAAVRRTHLFAICKYTAWMRMPAEPDPLVLAQGVNQSKIRSRTMRETRMFAAHPGILEERNCCGCPDWVPQPPLSNQT